MVSTHKKLYKNVDIATWQNRQYLGESHKTQNQRFGSLLINADFLRVGKEINSDLPKILAPSPRELPAKRGEGELTLGSPAAFAAGSVWRGSRAKQSNTPSVSRQKQAANTSDVTTSRIARNQRFRLSGRLREGG